jgi:hypothetical protein
MKLDISNAIANIFSGRKIFPWWNPSAKYAKYDLRTQYIKDIKDLSNVMEKYEEVTPQVWRTSKDGPQVWRTSKDGKEHSYDDLPAVILYRQDGTLWYLIWYKDGEGHRDGDEPAMIAYDSGGYIKDVFYYKNGKMHRDGDEPARIEFRSNGTAIEAEWFSHGTRYKTMRYNTYGQY